MTVDELAARMECGCDYCGNQTYLERYVTDRVLANGFRCIDADACDRRDLAAQDAAEAAEREADVDV